MNATTLPYRQAQLPARDMGTPVVKSLMFHGIVITLLIVGLPFLKATPPDLLAQSMMVELVTIEEVTQTNKQPTVSKPVEKPVEQPPMPQMPTVTAKTPPKPTPVEKPKPAETVKPPEEKPKAEVVEKPKPAVAPPKPDKRPVLTQPQPEEQQEDFQGLLRNLMKPQPTTTQPVEKPVEKAAPEPSPLARFAQQMSMSELDALKQQLSQCWSVLAGARYAEGLIVDIRLFVNPDRTIRSAEIVDKMRYLGDSHFQAAADAAMRAVRNPRCNPLDLPPNKYEQWKVITVRFDPREIL